MLSPKNATPALPRGRWLAAGVLVLAVLAAYANTLGVPFVYDDTLAIPQNPSIRKLWPLSDVLMPQVAGGVTVSGRPVLNLSFALNHAVSGTAGWSYHVFNILIHAGAALLLLGIVRRTWRGRAGGSLGFREGASFAISPRVPGNHRRDADATGVAVAIAGLWALHPLQTQAVTYTVQRAESLMGFFFLLTLYGFVRAAGNVGQVSDLPSWQGRVTDPPYFSSRWMVVSVSACASGMATKEVMATAPLLVFLYDRTFVAGSFRKAWKNRRGFYLALASTWLVLGAALASTGGNRGGTVGLGVGQPLWAYPLTQFEALSRYLGLSAWPHPLIFEYGTFWVRRAEELLPYALVVLPLLAATIVALLPLGTARSARWPVAGFLGAWFFLILAPTSLAPGTIQMIVEHRMYLPLAAVTTVGVAVLWRMIGRRTLVALFIAMPALLLLTIARNHDYRSPLALWSDTVAKRPLNPRAHEGLAEALEAAGRFDEAVNVRQESVRLLPDESHYHYNLALALAETGRTEEAAQKYRMSLRLYPNEARTHNNLAILLAQLGRHDESLIHYGHAVRLKSDNALYRYNHGIALHRAGQFEAAVASYMEAIRLRPDYADAHFNLGTALVRLARLREAIEHYGHAVRLKPDDAEYGITHGGALLLAGRPGDALHEFEQVQARDPKAIEATFGAGNALAALDRRAEAAVRYEATLRAKPDHASAHFKLGNVLLDLDRVSEALTHYEAAVRIQPNDAEAHHNLGIAFARLERWEEARRAFDEALRLKPDYADARRSREQLRNVIGR